MGILTNRVLIAYKISQKLYDYTSLLLAVPVISAWQLNLSCWKCQCFITARCTLVQTAVLWSHVVCLSVCPFVRL